MAPYVHQPELEHLRTAIEALDACLRADAVAPDDVQRMLTLKAELGSHVLAAQLVASSGASNDAVDAIVGRAVALLDRRLASIA